MLRSMLRNTCPPWAGKYMIKKYIRKVTRVGKRSLSVVIPAEIVKELGIRERQKLVVKRSGKEILISDWEK